MNQRPPASVCPYCGQIEAFGKGYWHLYNCPERLKAVEDGKATPLIDEDSVRGQQEPPDRC